MAALAAPNRQTRGQPLPTPIRPHRMRISQHSRDKRGGGPEKCPRKAGLREKHRMPSRHSSVFKVAALAAAIAACASAAVAADKKYDPGASDTEIKLGQTIPYSGAGSLYGVIGRTQA